MRVGNASIWFMNKFAAINGKLAVESAQDCVFESVSGVLLRPSTDGVRVS